MSLKIVKRHNTKNLYIRGTVRGTSVCESTGTADPTRAEEFRAKREAELWTESIYGKKATVTFAHAVAAYLEAEERSETTKFHLRRLLNHFGTTRLIEIAQPQLDDAYRKILRDGIAASSATKMRGVLTPLRAVLEFAAIRQLCDRPAFDTPRIPRGRTTYLKPAEVRRLIDAAAPHLKPLLTFLVGTGVRMSEALDLEWKDVDLRGKQAVVWQKQGNERRLDLVPVVMEALEALSRRHGHVCITDRDGDGGFRRMEQVDVEDIAIETIQRLTQIIPPYKRTSAGRPAESYQVGELIGAIVNADAYLPNMATEDVLAHVPRHTLLELVPADIGPEKCVRRAKLADLQAMIVEAKVEWRPTSFSSFTEDLS